MQNPFLQPYNSFYGIPPFDKIKVKDFAEAIRQGIRIQNEEINNIIENTIEPTFINTILALENSGQVLKRTGKVMFNLSYCNTNEELQSVMNKMVPLLSRHNDRIFMNPKLFKKVSWVWLNRKKLKVTGEKQQLLKMYYKAFVRNGANLSLKDKNKVTEINQRLSVLSLQFGHNILAVINDFKLIIDNENDLKGIPNDFKTLASDAAKKEGFSGKWLFTLQHASAIPFLQYSENRSLREKMWSAYVNKGNHGDKNDNKAIAKEIVNLRSVRARILGYKSHSHYILEEQMARKPEDVKKLLNKLWKPSLKLAMAEKQELQEMIYSENQNFNLEAWDWRYYAEKLRKKKYDVDEETLKPYFLLENVLKGILVFCQKLYGLSFHEKQDLPKYHSDIIAYEVKSEGNKTTGILYLDFYSRSNKQGGAWMTSFTEQKKEGKVRILPIISIVCNFNKPGENARLLLSYDEVNTFFHEFGHALHGLLSDVQFESLSGTNVPTDFVELPSQIMENWCSEPEALKMYAKHYQTNVNLPDSLIEKIDKSSKYGQGFATVEYLAAAFLDIEYHTLENGILENVEEFESNTFKKLGMMPEIISRYRTPYFSHIFSGGYSSCYYSYIWSEVLDADAFGLFKKNGIFDMETARSFKNNVLMRGGSQNPMQLYVKFRGKKPDIESLVERKGFNIIK